MNRDLIRQTATVIALVATIIVNGLANALPFNGQTTGEISDRFPVRFVPAGYVFAIWGLIYLALAAFAVYQALPAQREHPVARRIGWLFVLSCGFNAAWLVSWHYNQFPLTMALILGLLGSLIAIYGRIRAGELSRRDRWLIRAPFSIYLGWVTVATIANASITLYSLGWSTLGLSAEAWAAVLIVIGLAITAFISLRLGDVAYGLVIVWAYVGIVIKQSDAQSVALAAGVGAALAAGMAAAAFWRQRARPAPRSA